MRQYIEVDSRGAARSNILANQWYERSAQAGYFSGQFHWATVLLDAARIDDAVHWFEHAALGATAAMRAAILERIGEHLDQPNMRDLHACLPRPPGPSN